MSIGGFSLPLHPTKNTANPKMTAHIKPAFFCNTHHKTLLL
ncbi:hypothetical protein HPHPH4_0136 [Helicobacter pylori Hp H-4]|nr:hypothetical protein HPHPH4_0136 [Helicobacter pylori Hp H-4]